MRVQQEDGGNTSDQGAETKRGRDAAHEEHVSLVLVPFENSHTRLLCKVLPDSLSRHTLTKNLTSSACRFGILPSMSSPLSLSHRPSELVVLQCCSCLAAHSFLGDPISAPRGPGPALVLVFRCLVLDLLRSCV